MTPEEQQRLNDKVAQDDEFRLRLLKNPETAARELDIQLSAEEIRLINEAAKSMDEQDGSETPVLMGILPFASGNPHGKKRPPSKKDDKDDDD